MNKEGEVNIIHKQNNNTGRYYSNKFSLQNTLNEDLPENKYSDIILTMNNISNKKYKKVKLFYKKMKFRNLREYLECYLTSDIILLSDVFNNFRKIMYDHFYNQNLNLN